MKLLFKTLCIAILAIVSSNVNAQVCPSLTANNPSVGCAAPCATLTATPNTDLLATTTYSVSAVPYVPYSYTAGTSATFSGSVWSGTTDDYFGDQVILPFTFCFFGNAYNAIAIGTNGNITFNATGAGSLVNSYDPYSISGPLPGSNSNATQNCIMGVWLDTYAGLGDIKYATYGTAPCRKFVVSWGGVALFWPGFYCDGNTLTSQIVLYETTNAIDIYIGNRVPCTDWNSGYAVTGIENADGTVFYCPPGENGTTFTATNEGWRFTPTGAPTSWSYSWSGPSGVVGTGSSIVVCPTATTVYSVTATNTSCAPVSISTTSTVTVSGAAIGGISGIFDICDGATSTLVGDSPGGVWSSSNSAIASVDAVTGVVTGVSAGTATISYTLTGCTAIQPFTVHAIPNPPVINTDVYCQYEAPHAVSATGTNLLWYGPGVTTAMSIAPTPSTTTAGTITYHVTQTSPFGCVSDSAIDVVTIKPKPSALTTRDTSYCQYTEGVPALNVQVSGMWSGATLNWYSFVGSSLSGAPTPNSAYPDYPTGTIWQVSQVLNGCESDKVQVKATILPTPRFSMVYDHKICTEDTLHITYTLTGFPLALPTYTWTMPSTSHYTNGTSDTSSYIDVYYDTTHVLSNIGMLTISNLGGLCSTTDTFEMIVGSMPKATLLSKEDICLGDTVLLGLDYRSSNAYTFSWKIDNVPLLSSPDVQILYATANTSGPYTLVWKNTGAHVIELGAETMEGCKSLPQFDTIKVHELPIAFFTVEAVVNKNICLKDSLRFEANSEEYYNSYIWSPERYFLNNTGWNTFGMVDNTPATVTLTVTDAFGCISASSQVINSDLCCPVYFADAFTPNGDGRNDFFRPIFDGYHEFSVFRIMNRWGQTIFDAANTNPVWNGEFGGQPQDMGVYFYYIKYECNGKTVERTGDFTLVR